MNIVFWVGVKNKDFNTSDKHGNFLYFEYSKNTWKYWCEKNNVTFYEYTVPGLEDTATNKITWQRWFDLEMQLKDFNWSKVAVVDASYMIRWDAPNFFNLVSEKLNCFQSLENVNWVDQGIQGYQHLFPKVNFDLKRYIDCGFQIFTKNHLSFLNKLKTFYFDNIEEILILQNKIGRGTDQPVYNYLLQQDNVDFEFTLPNSFNLNHMNRFNWFHYNWQLNEDKTPYFIKYGQLWKFSGFDRKQRNELMSQTWNIVKEKYV
jgi:hypothetical protein